MIFLWRQFCAVAVTAVLFSYSFAGEQTSSNVPKSDGVVILINSQKSIPSHKEPTSLLASHPRLHNTTYGAPITTNPHEAKLLPHRATYAVSLDKTFDPEIQDVTGTMTIEITDAGDKWTYEKKATLLVNYRDRRVEQIIIKVASWESKEEMSLALNGSEESKESKKEKKEGGPKYHFYTKVKRGTEILAEDEDLENDQDQGTIIQGEALMATAQGEGIVTYQSPQSSKAQLPIGTLFPLRHMAQLMHEAVKGKNVCSHFVFDGENESIAFDNENESDVENEPNVTVRVNTVITPVSKSNVKFSDLVPFPTNHMWLMHMAVYDINAEDNPDPDYEFSQTVLPHGIIARMTYNFGDFNAHLKLTELEFFE
jgi:hypothetical protein